MAVRDYLGLSEFDLVYFHHSQPEIVTRDIALSKLAVHARRVTAIDRRSNTLIQLSKLLLATGAGPRIVFLAAIAHGPILLMFRICPRLRLRTFDEGTYNVAADGPFFRPGQKRLRSLRQLLLSLFFPSGELSFAKHRSEFHYTALPPQTNYMPDKAVRIPINWAQYVSESEVRKVEKARRLLILPCLRDFSGSKADLEKITSLAETCDLVVRHPRDSAKLCVNAVSLNSPIEAVIDRLRETRSLEVFHYASTVGLSVQGWRGVHLVDLHRPSSSTQ